MEVSDIFNFKETSSCSHNHHPYYPHHHLHPHQHHRLQHHHYLHHRRGRYQDPEVSSDTLKLISTMEIDPKRPELSSNARELLPPEERPTSKKRAADGAIIENYTSSNRLRPRRPYLSYLALNEEARRLSCGESIANRLKPPEIRPTSPAPARLSGSPGTFIQHGPYIEVELPQPRRADPNRGQAQLMPKLDCPYPPQTLITNPLWFGSSIPDVAKYASNAQAIFQSLAEEHREITVELMRKDWCRWDRVKETAASFRAVRTILLPGPWLPGKISGDGPKLNGTEAPIPPAIATSTPEVRVGPTPPVVMRVGRVIEKHKPFMGYITGQTMRELAYATEQRIMRSRWLKKRGLLGSLRNPVPDNETGRPELPDDYVRSNRLQNQGSGSGMVAAGPSRGPNPAMERSCQIALPPPPQNPISHPHHGRPPQALALDRRTALQEQPSDLHRAIPSAPGTGIGPPETRGGPPTNSFDKSSTGDTSSRQPTRPSDVSSRVMHPPALDLSGAPLERHDRHPQEQSTSQAPQEHRRRSTHQPPPDINSDKDYERGHAILIRTHHSRHPKAFDKLSASELKDVIAHLSRMYDAKACSDEKKSSINPTGPIVQDNHVTLQSIHADVKRMGNVMAGVLDTMRLESPIERALHAAAELMRAQTAGEDDKVQEEAKYIRWSVRNGITMAMRISSNFRNLTGTSYVKTSLCLSPRYGGDMLHINGQSFSYTAKFEKDKAIAQSFGFNINRVRQYGREEVRMDILQFRNYVGELPWFSREDTEFIQGPRLVLVNPVTVSYDIESAFSFTVSGEFVSDGNEMSRL